MSLLSGMKLYTVHIKPGMDNAAQTPIFVREGFNFWAFLFTLLWALTQRLWLVFFLLLGVNSLIIYMLKHHMFSLPSLAAMNIGFHLWVGFAANDWLRAKLAHRGYIIADIAAGDTLLRAEQRYFERMLAAA